MGKHIYDSTFTGALFVARAPGQSRTLALSLQSEELEMMETDARTSEHTRFAKTISKSVFRITIPRTISHTSKCRWEPPATLKLERENGTKME